jgi:hypothetical protein
MRKPLITQKFIDSIQGQLEPEVGAYTAIELTLLEWAIIRTILKEHIKEYKEPPQSLDE